MMPGTKLTIVYDGQLYRVTTIELPQEYPQGAMVTTRYRNSYRYTAVLLANKDIQWIYGWPPLEGDRCKALMVAYALNR